MPDEQGCYFVALGYYYPLWYVTKTAAYNVEADDFGDSMSAEEFYRQFPNARPLKAEKVPEVLSRLTAARKEHERS